LTIQTFRCRRTKSGKLIVRPPARPEPPVPIPPDGDPDPNLDSTTSRLDREASTPTNEETQT
jgi:hypothetical protein